MWACLAKSQTLIGAARVAESVGGSSPESLAARSSADGTACMPACGWKSPSAPSNPQRRSTVFVRANRAESSMRRNPIFKRRARSDARWTLSITAALTSRFSRARVKRAAQSSGLAREPQAGSALAHVLTKGSADHFRPIGTAVATSAVAATSSPTRQSTLPLQATAATCGSIGWSWSNRLAAIWSRTKRCTTSMAIALTTGWRTFSFGRASMARARCIAALTADPRTSSRNDWANSLTAGG